MGNTRQSYLMYLLADELYSISLMKIARTTYAILAAHKL